MAKVYTRFWERAPPGSVAFEPKRTRNQLGYRADRASQELRYFYVEKSNTLIEHHMCSGKLSCPSSDLCTYVSKADSRTLPPTFKTEAARPSKEGLEDIICIKVYREEKEVVSPSETVGYIFHHLEIVAKLRAHKAFHKWTKSYKQTAGSV